MQISHLPKSSHSGKELKTNCSACTLYCSFSFSLPPSHYITWNIFKIRNCKPCFIFSQEIKSLSPWGDAWLNPFVTRSCCFFLPKIKRRFSFLPHPSLFPLPHLLLAEAPQIAEQHFKQVLASSEKTLNIVQLGAARQGEERRGEEERTRGVSLR